MKQREIGYPTAIVVNDLEESKCDAWQDIKMQTVAHMKEMIEETLFGEAQTYVGGSRYERTPTRSDYLNGYYTRNLVTSLGYISQIRIDIWKEIRRRIRPMSSFTDPQSCERIIYALVDTFKRENNGMPLSEENKFTQNTIHKRRN